MQEALKVNCELQNIFLHSHLNIALSNLTESLVLWERVNRSTQLDLLF